MRVLGPGDGAEFAQIAFVGKRDEGKSEPVNFELFSGDRINDCACIALCHMAAYGFKSRVIWIDAGVFDRVSGLLRQIIFKIVTK